MNKIDKKEMSSPRFRMYLDGSDCEYHSLRECNHFMFELINTLGFGLKCWTAFETEDPKTKLNFFITVLSLESSSSLHIWTSNKEVSLNIFSCKPFPKEAIEKAFKFFFKPENTSKKKA
jgi:hypothetical protein